MEDRTIVQALCDRDPAGLAAAYDVYAARLFDYCAGVLHDRYAAGDAVHDTFLVAADRAHQLRDPDRLRAWLYAIARNECLRQLRQRNRLAPLEKAGDVSDDSVDLDRGVAAQQAQALVRDAAAGLNPREREVLDLTLRHQLSGAELAAALGVTANHAHALTSKAREQLERSVGALLTARAGRGDCADLDAMLAGWDGEFTPLVRKRVSRHLEKCAVCGVRRAHEVRAEALFAALPLLALPALLRRKVLDSSVDLQRVAQHGRIATPFDGAGFPVPLDRRTRRARGMAWLSGAAVLALLLGGGVALSLRPGAPATLVEPARQPAATGAPLAAAPTDPPTGPASPSTAPTSMAPTDGSGLAPPSLPPDRATPAVRPPRPRRPSPTATTAPTSAPPTTPPPPPSPSPSARGPAPTVTAGFSDETGVCEAFHGTGFSDVATAPVTSATFVWWWDGESAHSAAMSSDRASHWTVAVTGLPSDTLVSFQVNVVGADGQPASSDVGSTRHASCIR